jgi:AcrR family transcriptional regulator
VKKGARISNGKANRNARGDKTRARILSVAERLFSEHGIDGVSMRTLAARSKVNLAAVHYYFGSKDALFEEMFARRARVITGKRLEMLAECRNGPGRAPLVNQILEAFLRPVLEDDREGGGTAYARIRTRLAAERSARARNLPSRFFDDSSHRFIDALAGALPHLPAEELYWRFNIMLGAMYFTMANPARIEYLSKGLVDMSDENRKISYLVDFFGRAFSSDPLILKASRKRDKPGRQKGRSATPSISGSLLLQREG